MKTRISKAQAAPRQTAARRRHQQYLLRLYISGMTTRSTLALRNIRKICEEHLAGRYDLEIIDLYEQPRLAEGEQIIAVPTLIRRLPQPLRRFIGDMSDTERILVGMDLRRSGDSGGRSNHEAAVRQAARMVEPSKGSTAR